MPPKAKAKAPRAADSAANLGFEAKLWLAADKLRNNMNSAQYTRHLSKPYFAHSPIFRNHADA